MSSILQSVFRPGPTVEHKPLPNSGKAGRNVPAAAASGITLLVAVVLALFFARPIFLVFLGLLVLLAAWEIAGALARKELTVVLPAVYLGALAMVAAASFGRLDWVMYSLYLSILIAVVWRIASPNLPGRPIADVMATVFTLVYIPFFASFVALISNRDDSVWPIIFFILVVVSSDLGGWIAGVLFGRHPMAPKLSPKKSWEGFAGSVFLSTAIALFGTIVMGIPWWWCIPLGLSGAGIGTIGDLLESLIKRDVGLKDMSGIMPGHGGIMDRLDSLVFAAPMFYLVYSLAFGW